MPKRPKPERDNDRAHDLAAANHRLLDALVEHGKKIVGTERVTPNMVKLTLGGKRTVCIRAIELDGRPVLEIKEQTGGTITTGDGKLLLRADPPQRQDSCPNCGTKRTESTVARGRLYCPTCEVCEPPAVDRIMRLWNANTRYRGKLAPNREAKVVGVFRHRVVHYASYGINVEARARKLAEAGATHLLVRQGSKLPWARFGERPTEEA